MIRRAYRFLILMKSETGSARNGAQSRDSATTHYSSGVMFVSPTSAREGSRPFLLPWLCLCRLRGIIVALSDNANVRRDADRERPAARPPPIPRRGVKDEGCSAELGSLKGIGVVGRRGS
jgi:hypothetical protein